MGDPIVREAAGNQPTAGMPRWVKVSAAIAAAVVVAIVLMLVLGGGEHGPGRHTGGGGHGMSTHDAGSG